MASRTSLRTPTRSQDPEPRTVTSNPTHNPRVVNGVRLVRGDGRMGRLEVSLAAPGPAPRSRASTGSGEWAPLCDDGAFAQQYAQLFCQRLGFKYGKQYFADGISNLASGEASPSSPVGGLTCGSGVLKSVAVGRIRLPDDAAVGGVRACLARASDCPRGRLVGLQCSDTEVPPSPVGRIRLIAVESNLQLDDAEYAPSDPPTVFRAELLINVSVGAGVDAAGKQAGGAAQPGQQQQQGGGDVVAVWAPLCAKVADVAQYQQDAEDHYAAGFWKMDPVANVACNQFQGFPRAWSRTLTGYLRAPIPLPDSVPQWDEAADGPQGAGANEEQEAEEEEEEASATSAPFDPARYSHWVTVVGTAKPGTQSLQEMDLKVSNMPCETGFLYKLACVPASV